VDAQNFDERVLKIISRAVPPEYKKVKITPESSLSRDLGLSSLALAYLVNAFEEEFGIDASDGDDDLNMSSLRTVKDVLRIGRELVQKAGGT
jgi:acyl carrier protein